MEACIAVQNGPYVADGSWLCENAKALNRNRRSYSSKTVSGIQFENTFDLEIELKNVILVAFRFFAFLHSQGQKWKCRRFEIMSALPHKADIAGRWFELRKGQQPISRRINCGRPPRCSRLPKRLERGATRIP